MITNYAQLFVISMAIAAVVAVIYFAILCFIFRTIGGNADEDLSREK